MVRVISLCAACFDDLIIHGACFWVAMKPAVAHRGWSLRPLDKAKPKCPRVKETDLAQESCPVRGGIKRTLLHFIPERLRQMGSRRWVSELGLMPHTVKPLSELCAPRTEKPGPIFLRFPSYLGAGGLWCRLMARGYNRMIGPSALKAYRDIMSTDRSTYPRPSSAVSLCARSKRL